MHRLFTFACLLFLLECCWSAPTPNQLAFGLVRPVAVARYDAIVFPGTLSSHAHYFMGASNPSPTSSFQSLRSAKCSTLGVGRADLSSYWMPSVYYRAPGGSSFTLLTSTVNKVYYNWNADGSNQPFPDDFKMLVGSPKSLGNCQTGGPTDPLCPYYQRYWYCNGQKWKGQTAPRLPCTRLGLHITFPSCWDGAPFDLSTQDQHLYYGKKTNNIIKCKSPSHIALPEVMYSWQFDTNGIPANGPDEDTWVLSMGTNGGAGLHADFMNGWDSNVLRQVIDQCHNLKDNTVTACPPLAALYNKNAAASCTFEGLLPAEDVGVSGQPLSRLATSTSDCTPPILPITGFTNTKKGIILPLPASGTCPSNSGPVSPSSSLSLSQGSAQPTSIVTPPTMGDDEGDDDDTGVDDYGNPISSVPTPVSPGSPSSSPSSSSSALSSSDIPTSQLTSSSSEPVPSSSPDPSTISVPTPSSSSDSASSSSSSASSNSDPVSSSVSSNPSVEPSKIPVPPVITVKSPPSRNAGSSRNKVPSPPPRNKPVSRRHTVHARLARRLKSLAQALSD